MRTNTAIATKATQGRSYTVRTPKGVRLGTIVRAHSGWKASFGAGDVQVFSRWADALGAF